MEILARINYFLGDILYTSHIIGNTCILSSVTVVLVILVTFLLVMYEPQFTSDDVWHPLRNMTVKYNTAICKNPINCIWRVHKNNRKSQILTKCLCGTDDWIITISKDFMSLLDLKFNYLDKRICVVIFS